jgi:hypothetical protein
MVMVKFSRMFLASLEVGVGKCALNENGAEADASALFSLSSLR